MSNTGLKNPVPTTKVRLLRAVLSRPTFGVFGSAVAIRVLPSLPSNWQLPNLQLPLITSDVVGAKQLAVTAATVVIGYSAGICFRELLGWIRLRIIKSLLAYHGWLFQSNANSTKIWGLCLKLFVGPGPHGTFEFQQIMPKLPVPDVADSCKRYLEIVRPFLTPDEYKHTELLTQQFLAGEANKLQQYLKDRDKKLTSWLSDWWLTKAYLARRDSVAINVNFFMTSMFMPEVSCNPIARVATCLYNAMRYQEMIQKRSLPPDLILDTIPVCMDGARFLFSSCRIPGESVDTLEMYPESTHAVVLCKSCYYRLEMYEKNAKGELEPLSKLEIKNQLDAIVKDTRDVDADHFKAKNAVAVLTAGERTTWARNRKRLQSNPVNAAILKDIESAIFVQVIGDVTPKDMSHMAKLALAGDGTNRWFDKSNTLEIFKDTSMGGANMEHSGADATHFAVMWEHCLQMEVYGPDGDIPAIDGEVPRKLAPPKKLEWQIDEELQAIIDSSLKEYRTRVDALDCNAFTSKFGKKEMKKMRVSPDGFLQMAIQLAYFRMHGKITKTYEPASTRLFAFGRTDNINPVSEYSVKLVQQMDEQGVERDSLVKLVRDAITYQNKARLEATAGYGCERHLLGLSMAANELGMDLPALFTDKAFSLPMHLSTSQVPTQITKCCPSLVPESVLGGFGPDRDDGYGILYVSGGDNSFNFVITSWHTCTETDSQKLASMIVSAMEDMKELLT